jgi:hypothetical protein
MKKYIVSSVIAMTVALVGAASVNAAYNANLSVGSTGADVSALQAFLISKGHEIKAISSGAVAPGYFGSQTKTAVMAYQASVGVPSTGFVGPLTRGVLNGTTAPVAVACPVGFTCTANAGTATTPVATPGVITTTGVEGTLAVTSYSSGLASTVYENDSMVAILGFQAEAKNSDIAIQRVKLNLGNSTKFYNKIFKKIYITDTAGAVLASSDLNSSTVIKDGSTYYITIAGMNSVVPKNSKKSFLVKADVYLSLIHI